ncbi:hypothetical protein [Hymenobacter sp. IS2118]|uniref:hypothetical protein n=1 Tax=Hymenobacter sp. IS2118 TaxID=1505605 RepID=UPI001268F3DB|nr:hypothetical protein [Hymenobacter sp. IS2118]
MLTDFIDKYQTAKIVLLQTTYMHLAVGDGVFKIAFKDKAEYFLKRGKSGPLSYYTNHPLLLNHNEPRTTLYINSKPPDPQSLLEDIVTGINAIYQDWRDWRTTLFGNRKQAAAALAQQNLLHGNGILLDYAPAPIVRAVIAACEKHGVATRYFGSLEAIPSPRGEFKVLFIGPYYVIARDFRISTVS